MAESMDSKGLGNETPEPVTSQAESHHIDKRDQVKHLLDMANLPQERNFLRYRDPSDQPMVPDSEERLRCLGYTRYRSFFSLIRGEVKRGFPAIIRPYVLNNMVPLRIGECPEWEVDMVNSGFYVERKIRGENQFNDRMIVTPEEMISGRTGQMEIFNRPLDEYLFAHFSGKISLPDVIRIDVSDRIETISALPTGEFFTIEYPLATHYAEGFFGSNDHVMVLQKLATSARVWSRGRSGWSSETVLSFAKEILPPSQAVRRVFWHYQNDGIITSY